MALIKCPECGREVSDKAPACIHCGYPLENIAAKEKNNTGKRNTYDFSPRAFAEAKRKTCELRTGESLNEFYKVFAGLVKNGEWVSAPSNNNQLIIPPFRGGHYIAIYSDMKGRGAGDPVRQAKRVRCLC